MAVPKDVYASDPEWIALQPVFATSNQGIVQTINRKIDYGQTDQMNKRWNNIEFFYQSKEGELITPYVPLQDTLHSLYLIVVSSTS